MVNNLQPPPLPRQGYNTPGDCMRHIIARVIYVAWEDMNGKIESTIHTRGREEEMKQAATEWIGSPVYKYYMECLGYDPDWGVEDFVMEGMESSEGMLR